jgi:hypothetical protein
VFNPGDSIVVAFTTSDAFNSGNVFTAQISGLNGSFAQARVIGVLEATSQGEIRGKLPCDLNPGTGYRVRVIANSPAATGPDNGANLEIRDRAPITITPSGPTTFCEGDSVILVADAGYQTYVWGPTGDTTRSKVVRQSGSYSIGVFDTNHCGLLARITVTVHPKPKPVIVQTGFYELAADSGFTTYQWTYQPDPGSPETPIPGATSDTLAGAKFGDYRVIVTDANGCTGQSEQYHADIEGVRWENAADAGVRIYPQPVHETVTIEAELDRLTEITITLADMNGRQVLRREPERVAGRYRREISLGKLPAGAYLLRLELGARRIVEKIVKNR